MSGAFGTVEAVVFDLDGTLIESAEAIRANGSKMVERFGAAPLTLDEAREFIGEGAPVFAQRALASRGITLSEADYRDTVERFLHAYEEAPASDNAPMPGVDAFLARLAGAGMKLALCTNKPGGPTRKILKAFGWDAMMAAVVAGDTLSVRKPDAGMLTHTMGEIGASRVLYVGDSEVDEATALAAQQPFALYSHGYRKKPVETFQAAMVFDDYLTLGDALLSG